MDSLNFAPGVRFFEDEHKYFLKDKELSGITGIIGKKIGLKMPSEFVGEHRDEGLHVHHAIQRWIETYGQVTGSVHPGVIWLTETIGDSCAHAPVRFYPEVLVSDGMCYASSVDIVVETEVGDLEIYDIKKGVFKRDYVSWQLGIYKYLIEKYGKRAVSKCTCACMKDREYYPIFPKTIEEVEDLLYGKNRKAQERS
jgi:hypothetical protein